MGKMARFRLDETLRSVAREGTPILGICLGLQLFFETSEESPNRVPGLGLLPGEIVRFPNTEGYKIPHMYILYIRII